MKKLSYFFAVLLALTACSKQPTFTVEGTIEGAKDSTLYLYNRSMDGIVLLDSVKADDEGHFSISATAPTSPDLYVLVVGGQGTEYINFSIDSTETVTIKGKLPALLQNYTVSGSDNSEKIRQLSLMHSQLQQQIFDVVQNTSLLNETKADSLQNMMLKYKKKVAGDYIFPSDDNTTKPRTAYAYFALIQQLRFYPEAPVSFSVFQLGDSIGDIAYRAVATCWKDYYPESERAQQLYNMVERSINVSRKQAAKQQQLMDEQRIVVSDIIDLSLPDRRMQMRTLSELKGQVVLLDFHIFSSPESGARILKLRELYNKYHDRGLEIYQVSIDQDEHLWKQSVSALPWISVYDPEASSCDQYNVTALPEYFLIDRNNSLQKRSLQVKDLDAEIEQLL